MSCCGESKDKAAPTNAGAPVGGAPGGLPMTQQPPAHPNMTYNPYQQTPDKPFANGGPGMVATPPPALHQQGTGWSTNNPTAVSSGYNPNQFGSSASPPPPGSIIPFGTPSPNPNQYTQAQQFAQQHTGTTMNGGYPQQSGFGSPPPMPNQTPGSVPWMDPNISRPTPVHAPGTPRPAMLTQPTTMPPKPFQPADDGKMSISVDFGTTTSGVAYGSSRINAGRVQNILHWPGSFETFRKVPTCLLYNAQGQVLAWGLEAKNASPMAGTIRCEWFKLFLEPRALRDPNTVDPRLPKLPPGKQAIDLIIDYLSCLFEYAKEQITRELGSVADLNSADVWLTVPAAWDAAGCELMRDAAIKAGLVQSAHAGDRNWKDRLRIITEPEAAAVHCAHLTDLHRLQPSQNFMICDAGGGTVDLAVYKIIGNLSNLEIAEVCARSGANCGSIFLDLRFRELVRTLLSEHPAHLDPASQAYFMHAFSETDKLSYMGDVDDDKYFHFTCFNVEDQDDPSVGLVNGELAIPGILLRREVFDPVIQEVLNLLEEQLSRANERIDALLLVGGFSGSEYMFRQVKQQFGARIQVIDRPTDADTATLRGAAQYGLAKRPLVSSVIAGRAYLMKVKLPADQEDWLKRPAYIKENNVGASVCENRIQYLVHKGAILRKGQRIKTKFCKFSASAADRVFVATLYTSDNDKVMRYSDEGPVNELCKWSVDLGVLPSFQYHASMPHPNGFYTEFELGLELDSAEVRGVLLHNGDEISKVVFDFFQ